MTLLSSLGISTIKRRFRSADLEYQPPPNNFIWSCYSREREIENANAILECVVSEYGAFIRGCAFRLDNSPYLDAATAIVFGYVSSHDRPVGYGPTLWEYHVRNPQGALPKTTVLSETLSREFGRAQPVSSAVIENERREVVRTISRSADFLFGGTPLLHFIYEFLADDLKRKYLVNVQ